MSDQTLAAYVPRLAAELARRTTLPLTIRVVEHSSQGGTLRIVWEVLAGQEVLGQLSTVSSQVAEQCLLYWRGRIPGYRNVCGQETVVLSWVPQYVRSLSPFPAASRVAISFRRGDHNDDFTEFP
jgi:hypothetical protein